MSTDRLSRPPTAGNLLITLAVGEDWNCCHSSGAQCCGSASIIYNYYYADPDPGSQKCPYAASGSQGIKTSKTTPTIFKLNLSKIH